MLKSDLNASLQKKVLVITALKEQLNKLKGKVILTEAVFLNPIDPALLQVNVALLVSKLHKNRTAHTDYIRQTQEEAATLREIIESKRLLSPLNTSLAYALTPKNKTKQIRRTAQITKSERTTVATSPSANIDSNTPVLSSTGVTLVSSASGSMSQDNTKKNRIRQTQKKAKKTELEDHLRTVKSSLNKASIVDSKANSSVIKLVSNMNSNLKCASYNGCLFSDNHDACVVAYINSVNARKNQNLLKHQLKGRIAITTIVPPREPIPIVKSTKKPVVTLVVQIVLWYLDSICSKHMTGDRSQLINFVQKFLGTVKFGNDHVAKIMGYGDYQIGNVTISRVYYVEGLGHNLFSLVEIVLFIVYSRCSKHMMGNLMLLINFVKKFMGTVKFGNDQIAPFLGYGDLVQGSVTIKRVYYVEGLNHNLFSVGQFCDANLEVAFRKSTCYIRDLKGNDLLTGSHDTDLYSITLQDTNFPNPICLMAKASSS
nr:integrase, catalytic region, zinc finger, CCHC-type, peptidase aspartic, catalytic [Tanacetum cinerariifolium]